MAISIQHFCCPGRIHMQRKALCQDRFSKERSAKKAAISLCDGAGTSAYGRIAAETVGKLLTDFIIRNFYVFLYDFPENIKRSLTYELDKSISELAAAMGIEVTLLATTFMAAAADENGNYISLQLGDGMILREDQNGRYRRVSLPGVGMLGNETYLTGNCSVFEHTQLYRWHGDDLKRILLLTNGAYENIGHGIGFEGESIWSIRKRLIAKNPCPWDDYSVASLRIE